MNKFHAPDHLEPRRFLAAALNGDLLEVTGTSAAENIVITNDLLGGEVEVQFGSDPADTFPIGDVGRIRVFAGDGNDQVQFLNEFDMPITVYCGAGDDRIDAGNLRLLRGYGEDGNDTLRITGSSRDTLYGGPGNDILGSNGGRDLLCGEDGDDDLNGGGMRDRLVGGDGNDQLNGGNSDPGGAESNDAIEAGEGNDNINGGPGADSLDGGPGDDRIYGGSEVDTIAGGEGNNSLYGESGDDDITSGSGNDFIVGGNDNDKIRAGAGDDRIFGDEPQGGGSGQDYILAGIGSDSVAAGAGHDQIYDEIDNALSETATIAAEDGSDTIRLRGEPSGGANTRTTIKAGAGDDYVYGSNGPDLIFGNEGDDLIFGFNDNDTILGGGGNDRISGAFGPTSHFAGDSIRGGAGADVFAKADVAAGDVYDVEADDISRNDVV